MTVFAVEYLYDASTAARRDEVRADHRGWLAGVADRGQLLASGPYDDGSGALLLFKADDAEALQALLAEDPYSVAGLISGLTSTAWSPVSGPLAAHF
ncbi:YciI family protein [Sinomonas sp. P47F7]|uniref:YciI family protein n=1 Tax=Sinomonas sp. P47F7 TaxID=3410987 RepID=UPI003BF4B8D2